MSILRNSLWMCALLLLAACSDYPSSERWTASEVVQVFDDVEGDPLFRIQPGEQCRPIRDRIGKVDLYTRVECPMGKGWVRSDSKFQVNP